MKVTLIQTTQNAAEMIILSQSTRLLNSAKRWEDILLHTSHEEKSKQLDYAFKTIKGSFEFVDYIFLIEDVTRALTHQLVRYRIGTSFAQQSQMFEHLEDLHYFGEGIIELPSNYHNAIRSSFAQYHTMMNNGVDVQIARGVLPTDTLTNILVKINLRSFCNLLHQRLCLKIIGEFQQLAAAIQTIVVNTHPFTSSVLGPECLTRGVCIFPSAKDCFIRDNYSKHSTLDGFSDEIKAEIRKIWIKKYGFDPQPIADIVIDEIEERR